MKSDTISFATYLGYNFVRVTRGMNDYPENTYTAITGFYTFDEAKEIADRVGGEVVLLTKRDGHQFYVNNGRVDNGIDVSTLIDENEVMLYKSVDTFEQDALEYIKALIEEGTDICNIAKLSETMSNTYDELYAGCDDNIAIVSKLTWEVEEITPLYVTKKHDDDVTLYEIAVVDYETDEDVVKRQMNENN